MQDTSYHSIEDITIWVFHEILKTSDLTLLGKHENPSDVWFDIYNEYCIRAKVDNTNIKQMALVEGLKGKHKYFLELLEKLRYTYYLKEIEEIAELHKLVADKLRSKGYLFDASKPFEKELERLLTQLESLKMKIHIEDSKIEKSDKKLAVNVWKDIAYLQTITDIKLNPKQDVMAYMIEVSEMASEIIKSKKQSA